MQVLEDRIPFRTGQLVDIGDGGFGVAGAVTGPARQQRRDQIRDRSANRLIDVQLRGRILLQLQIAHADDKPGNAIGFVYRQNAIGELHGLVDIAVGERRNERAIEQFVVLRIGAKRRAIERRRRIGVPLHAGVTGGQIAARRSQRFQIVAGGKLRRVVGRMIGRLCPKRSGHGQRGKGENGNRRAIETNGKHQGSPSSRIYSRNHGRNYGKILRSISNADPAGGIKPHDNAAFGAQPQGYGVANPVARKARMAADLASQVSQLCLKTLSVWRYRGRTPRRTTVPMESERWSHAIVVTSPHNWARRRPPVEPR